MPKSYSRLDRVNQLIQEQVGEAILRELDINKNILLTVTRVESSSDLKHATVYVSVVDKSQQQEMLEKLKKIAGGIQKIVNRKLSMHYVPRLLFKLDDKYEKEQRIYDILERVKGEEKN